MTCIVMIPTPLRPVAGGRSEVQVEGKTVRDALDALERACEGMRAHIREENGDVRRFVNIFLDDEEIQQLDGLDSAVREGAIISIVPALAGGASGNREHRGRSA